METYPPRAIKFTNARNFNICIVKTSERNQTMFHNIACLTQKHQALVILLRCLMQLVSKGFRLFTTFGKMDQFSDGPAKFMQEFFPHIPKRLAGLCITHLSKALIHFSNAPFYFR